MKDKTDSETTLEELKQLVARFRDERGWGVHHSAKNLAMSIAIEAAELMELFQWDEYTLSVQQEVADELSDVLLYCFNLADTLGIDITSAYKDKLRRAAIKYPVSMFHPGQDNPETYKKIKKAYREKKQS